MPLARNWRQAQGSRGQSTNGGALDSRTQSTVTPGAAVNIVKQGRISVKLEPCHPGTRTAANLLFMGKSRCRLQATWLFAGFVLGFVPRQILEACQEARQHCGRAAWGRGSRGCRHSLLPPSQAKGAPELCALMSSLCRQALSALRETVRSDS